MPLLERAGHRVVARDLPGMADDKTPLTEVSLDSWTEFLCGVIDEQDEPVVLVGHSRGGLNITQAAEHRPDRTKRLVYLCAYLPRDGETVLGLTTSEPGGEVDANLVVSDDQVSVTLKDEAVEQVFYGDCSPEDIAQAKARLTPEPLAPASTPVSLTEENFGRVPRTYIECLADRAIPPSLQKRMFEASPCERVITMSTSHSPFLSAPEELAGHLLELCD